MKKVDRTKKSSDYDEVIITSTPEKFVDWI